MHSRLTFAVTAAFFALIRTPVAAQTRLTGDSSAVAAIARMIEATGGRELWVNAHSMYLEYRGITRASRTLPDVERAWRDLRAPRLRIEHDAGELSRTTVFDGSDGWRRSSAGLSDLTPLQRLGLVAFWPRDFYNLFRRLALPDSDLFVRSFPPKVAVLSRTQGEIGWFEIGTDGSIIRWGTLDDADHLEYVYGPMRAFGPLRFPAWGAQVNAAWRWEYDQVELSDRPLADSLFARPSAPMPEVFAPGVISTGDAFSLALSPDSRRAVFTKSSPDRRRMALYESVHDGREWSPARLLPFSGRFRDLDPSFHPDGRTLFFNSFRNDSGSAERADTEIWTVSLDGDRWGVPRRVPGVGSTTLDDFPSVSADGTLYFASDRSGTHHGLNIFASRLTPSGYEAPRPVDALNTDDNEANPFVSANGRVMVFASTRPGGNGRPDLWVSARRGNNWTTPRHLDGIVNTTNAEFCPTISPDGRYLYFSRIHFDGGVRGNEYIYRIPLTAVMTPDELAVLRRRD